MTPTAIPALAPVLRSDEGVETILVLLEAVVAAAAGTVVPVAEAVGAVPVSVGVFEGVIIDGKLLVSVAVFFDVDEVVEVASTLVDDDEEAESSLMIKYELTKGSPKL